MEIAIPIIVLLILGVGLYILIKNQIDSNSSKTQEQMELKLNAFVESFKLTSAENMAKQLKESKDDKEIFENPNSLKVAEISNDPPMNIIEAKISDNQIRFEGIDVEAPKHLSKLTEDGLKIGLRSSDIELDENGHEFEVELAEISGSETLLHLKRGNTKIIVSIEEVLNFKIHDKIKINFKIDKAYAFHADGKLASSPLAKLKRNY